MTHRKHVHEWEINPVATVIREHLTEMVPYHEGSELLTSEEQSLFHVLYRFENNRVGQPSYPEPPTWGTVANYIGVMVPLYSIEYLYGELESDNPAPIDCIPEIGRASCRERVLFEV